jgi:hypothetical protein
MVIGIVVLALGTLAYFFKSKDKFRYGIVEIIFAFAGTIAALQAIAVSNFFTTLVALASCAYVVSRGCDNIKRGYPAYKRKKMEEERREYVNALHDTYRNRQ